jgi:hypothetical protein
MPADIGTGWNQGAWGRRRGPHGGRQAALLTFYEVKSLAGILALELLEEELNQLRQFLNGFCRIDQFQEKIIYQNQHHFLTKIAKCDRSD